MSRVSSKKVNPATVAPSAAGVTLTAADGKLLATIDALEGETGWHQVAKNNS